MNLLPDDQTGRQKSYSSATMNGSFEHVGKCLQLFHMLDLNQEGYPQLEGHDESHPHVRSIRESSKATDSPSSKANEEAKVFQAGQ